MVNDTDLCKVCDGSVECAPTALLLVSLVHTLYGRLGPVPDWLGYRAAAAAAEVDVQEEESVTSDYEERVYSRNKKESHRQVRKSVYDFIIVGGGTAGCVLASRLSEVRKWKILLLEAGPEEPKLALVPGFASDLAGSSVDWNYSMRPKKGFCNNRGKNGCQVIQGRCLGGTSSINHMAYMRGSPSDYDDWALAGNNGWSFDLVLPYFKYSEGNYDRDIAKNKFYHSTQGPLDVGRYSYFDDNVDILLKALSQIGYNYTDINGKNQCGFMRVQTMSYYGERVSTYTAFIEPIRELRNNIDITTEALVVNLIFDSQHHGNKISGVEFLKNGEKHAVYATKEVILSAGAINTPKILMNSGIGPKEYLDFVGIPVYQDLAVGSNFHDHISVCLPIINLSKTATTVRFTDKMDDITKYYAKGTGPLSANFQVVAFMNTAGELEGATEDPDVGLWFRGYESNTYYKTIETCVSLLTPKSRGQVILNATEPIFSMPLIYPNYLSNASDQKKLSDGIQEMLRIFDTDVFQKAGFEFDPRFFLETECKSHSKVTDEFWLCIIRHFSAPMHNYVGTCKMGPPSDPDAVVDSYLRVHGVVGLRVVDSSVIPQIPRGSTAAPVIMLAEKASDIIKTFWYYKKEQN